MKKLHDNEIKPNKIDKKTVSNKYKLMKKLKINLLIDKKVTLIFSIYPHFVQ